MSRSSRCSLSRLPLGVAMAPEALPAEGAPPRRGVPPCEAAVLAWLALARDSSSALANAGPLAARSAACVQEMRMPQALQAITC